jgi:hypothetical protein
MTLRWTGSAWNEVPAPDPGQQFLDLDGVTTISATNAWAVGVHDVPGGRWQTLTMHWDGSAWSVVASPSPDPQINRLYGVSALPQGELWAVGYGGGTGTLALRRAGQSWVTTVTPNEGTGDNVLNGISVNTPRDIWAVGHAQQRSLTMHYDGSVWSVVPSPNREHGIRLEDVVAIASNDVWAVGWTGSNNFDDENIALHWDGTEWTIVPTPQFGTGIDKLLAIDAAGPNDVWATGFFGTAQGGFFSSILHWDGTSWSIAADDCDTYWGLTGVTVVSATDVWAVGNATTCHFDGKRWMKVPSPQPRPEYYEVAYPLEDVSGVTANDVWAVGARITDNGWYIAWQSIAEHWDGSEWTLTTFVPGTLLNGVEALSANNVWAVGRNSYGPLIVHYDGTEWSTVPTPEWGRGGWLGGIDVTKKGARPSPSFSSANLWAAGHYRPGNVGSRTLIQRVPSPTQGAVVGHSNVGLSTVSWFGPENGSTSTDPSGAFEVGGLQAGQYTFIATEPGCTPDSEQVTVVAGVTQVVNLQVDCDRPGRARRK